MKFTYDTVMSASCCEAELKASRKKSLKVTDFVILGCFTISSFLVIYLFQLINKIQIQFIIWSYLKFSEFDYRM